MADPFSNPLRAGLFNRQMQNVKVPLAGRVEAARAIFRDEKRDPWERCIAAAAFSYRAILDDQSYFAEADEILGLAYHLAPKISSRGHQVRWGASLLTARAYLNILCERGARFEAEKAMRMMEKYIGGIYWHPPAAVNICRMFVLYAYLQFLSGRNDVAIRYAGDVKGIMQTAMVHYEINNVHHAHEICDMANAHLTSQAILGGAGESIGEDVSKCLPIRVRMGGSFQMAMERVREKYGKDSRVIFKV